jgi:DNA-directed DNA polymerase III PolC
MDFIHLHNHSVFSFLSGVCTVKEMAKQAKSLGMRALALTDTDRMSGLIKFYQECKEQGIKPILGVELTEPEIPQKNLVLLAKNSDGYGDICEIITKRHIHKEAFCFKDIFAKPWPNLFILTNFPEVLYLLSQTPNRKNLYGELIFNSRLTIDRSRELNRAAEKFQIPVMASNDNYFLNKKDWHIHKVLRAIGLLSTLSRLKIDEFASIDAYFKTEEEMKILFSNYSNALKNTELIANNCNVSLSLGNWILPEISVPKGYTPLSYLKKLAFQGLKKNYGNSKSYHEAEKIQNMELKVISKLGYPSYFLMVKQIRDWANNKLKSKYRRPRDCSILRGSAANSITFFNIGVSDLDPIKYDLYFQRFLNEDRASPPDADLDFGWDERDQILDYMSETWGQDRVAMVCTTNHFRYRAAFRETAKVHGYTDEQVTEILKSWKTFSRRIEDKEIRFLMEIAESIRGKPRFLGQHPGGVLVTNDPIWRHVACQYSGGIKNRIITQIDMHNGLDELGLIKFDILGNGSLSVLRDTLHQIHDQGLPDPKVWHLEKCYHDPNVRDIISKGRTKGIFYIESPAQSRLNKKAQAQTFEEITMTSSLVRPAGSAYIKRFVERHRKRKEGIKDWDFLHPALEPILRDSYDVCAFQEDVTKICYIVAGLSYLKADKIRKMMNSLHEGRLSSSEYMETAKEFIAGCIKTSSFSKNQAVELWERVSSFTGFSFCKSHSASYAQLSFKCTYLKAYYPAQFFSSVISNNHGFYTTDVYLDEARRWGIQILPIDINESDIKYSGKHNWIRPGLMHIRNLSTKSMERIIGEREKSGRFHNIIEFVKRVKIHQKEIEYLIMVGAFDGFGLTRPELLFLLDGIYNNINGPEARLFFNKTNLENFHLHPGLSDYTFMEKCLKELYMLGFMLSANIVDILDLHPASKHAIPAKNIYRYKGKRIKVFGRKITERSHLVQKSRRIMKFLTIEDKTECIDVIFWPKKYDNFADEILRSGPFEIWGTVSEDSGTYTLEADSIRSVEWFPGSVDFNLASERLALSLKKNYTYDNIPIAKAG